MKTRPFFPVRRSQPAKSPLVLCGRTGSNEHGRFVISTLIPGRYILKAELPGFQTQVRSGVVISVGQEITIGFVLPAGAVAQEVTVSEEVPIIEVTATRVGANISNLEIDNLPSLGRSQLSLMQLVPGLTPVTPSP
jgi:hypothetical protein